MFFALHSSRLPAIARKDKELFFSYSPLFNPLFKLAIKYLEPTRHDPILRRFANAHEL